MLVDQSSSAMLVSINVIFTVCMPSSSPVCLMTRMVLQNGIITTVHFTQWPRKIWLWTFYSPAMRPCLKIAILIIILNWMFYFRLVIWALSVALMLRPLQQVTTSIMKAIFTTSLAKQFNYVGLRGKHGFGSLQLKEVVCGQ